MAGVQQARGDAEPFLLSSASVLKVHWIQQEELVDVKNACSLDICSGLTSLLAQILL